MANLFSPMQKLRNLSSSAAQSSSDPSHLSTIPSGSLQTDRPLKPAPSMARHTSSPQPSSPITPTQPSTLATLTHQNDLIANFWGGRSQGMQVRETREPPALQQKKPRHPSLDTFEIEDLKVTPEPKTLARSLFLYGFLFPLLWPVGIALIFSPTKYNLDLEKGSVGSAEQMQRDKAAYRAAEEKWAKRCMWAFATLLGLLVVIIITVVLAMKGK
ncbi:hypothetical protein BD414DRAFT_535356 [Trametes punicea]|nr:hypothetical protein BD414DRAFT_535356 [Trametes punicea]